MTEIPNLEITIIEIEIKEEYMLFRNRETQVTPAILKSKFQRRCRGIKNLERICLKNL